MSYSIYLYQVLLYFRLSGKESWLEGEKVNFRIASFQFLGPVVNIEGRLP